MMVLSRLRRPCRLHAESLLCGQSKTANCVLFWNMAEYSIYIVEDDPWYGEILQYHLGLNPDYKITRFQKAHDCLAKMHLMPDLITLDFSLPDMRGDKLFEKIREISPHV